MTNWTDKITDIIGILDESSSMSSLQDSTISGFNEFLDEQKKAVGHARLSLVTFGTSVRFPIEAENIQNIEPISEREYSPSGRTALLDAIGKSISKAEERIGSYSEEKKPDNVLFFITTDGEENASNEYGIEEISNRIEHLQNLHGWEFIFTGAGIDEFTAGKSINVNSQNIGGFDHSHDGVMANFSAVNKASNQMRSSGQVQEDWNDGLDDSGPRLDAGEDDEGPTFGGTVQSASSDKPQPA